MIIWRSVSLLVRYHRNHHRASVMLLKSLGERPSFVAHTGNLSQFTELMMKRHPNSSSEVTAAFKRLGKEDNTKLDFTSNVISLSHYNMGDVNKDDVKITLKVFLSSFSAVEAEEAVTSCMSELKVDAISQLIIQFPGESEDMGDDDWIASVQKVWKPLEKLIESGQVHVLGVADTDVDRLELLCNAVDEPPKIDHYSIDGCCTVPQELVEYAKAHDIQLLTHNDARVFELEKSFVEETRTIFGDDIEKFEPIWTARYTIWLRSRSVMAAKGYFVNFEKK